MSEDDKIDLAMSLEDALGNSVEENSSGDMESHIDVFLKCLRTYGFGIIRLFSEKEQTTYVGYKAKQPDWQYKSWEPQD